MPEPVANDADAIWVSLMKLRRRCFQKLGLTSSECWCWNGGGVGVHIPCSQANEVTTFDLMGKPAEKPREPLSETACGYADPSVYDYEGA